MKIVYEVKNTLFDIHYFLYTLNEEKVLTLIVIRSIILVS